MTEKQTDKKRVGDGTPGPGRKKGIPNKSTIAVKTALQSVYADLQASSNEEHGHFRTWAQANPTEFYKLFAKLLPIEVSGQGGGAIVVQVIKFADADHTAS